MKVILVDGDNFDRQLVRKYLARDLPEAAVSEYDPKEQGWPGADFNWSAYQVALAPVLGGQCRYHPTCSEYAVEALERHGPLGGTALAARRIARCHPFRHGGFDPVPSVLGADDRRGGRHGS